MVMDLAENSLGGEVNVSQKYSSRKAAHLIPLPFLSGPEHKELFNAAKKRYYEKWAEFEKDVSIVFELQADGYAYW